MDVFWAFLVPRPLALLGCQFVFMYLKFTTMVWCKKTIARPRDQSTHQLHHTHAQQQMGEPPGPFPWRLAAPGPWVLRPRSMIAWGFSHRIWISEQGYALYGCTVGWKYLSLHDIHSLTSKNRAHDFLVMNSYGQMVKYGVEIIVLCTRYLERHYQWNLCCQCGLLLINLVFGELPIESSESWTFSPIKFD